MKSLAEYKHTDIYVGMEVISATGRPGQITEIEYDGRMGPDDPTVWMVWDNGKKSGWWLSQLEAIKVKE